MYTRLALISLLIVSLAGCVHHLNQNECMNMNWRQLGTTDGAAGRPPRNLQNNIKDCEKFKIPVDQKGYHAGYRVGIAQFCTPSFNVGVIDGQAGKQTSVIYGRQNLCTQQGQPLKLANYKKGRLKGLENYCTYDNGKNIALQGQMAPQVCPISLASRFMRGWKAGSQIFCSNVHNAFVLGKSGAAYPTECPAATNIAFKSEYDRGYMVRNRIIRLQRQIRSINDTINSQVVQYNLFDGGNGVYTLGPNQSPQAQYALRNIRRLVRERARKQNQLFNAKSKA